MHWGSFLVQSQSYHREHNERDLGLNSIVKRQFARKLKFRPVNKMLK